MIESFREFLRTSTIQSWLAISLIFFLNVLLIQIMHDKIPGSTVSFHIGIGGGRRKKNKGSSSSSNHRSKGGGTRGSGTGRR